MLRRGREFLFDAMEKGADAFVTGEVKHHEILAAKEAGLTWWTAGISRLRILHGTLRERLSRAFPGIEFFPGGKRRRRHPLFIVR